MFSNNSIFVDCDQVCRVCLSGTVELQHIYGQNDNNTIADILRNLTSISIDENDGMPQKICTLCVHQANSAHYFILKCKETDRMLKQNLFVTKDDSDALQIGIIDFDVNDADHGDDKVYGIDSLESPECDDIADLYDIKVEEARPTFNCDKCVQSWSCESELQRHRDDAHPIPLDAINDSNAADDRNNENKNATNKSKPFECLKCNKTFRMLHSYNKHNKIHIHNDVTCICELCGRTFSGQSQLKLHFKETHEAETTNTNFTCTVCGKQMKRMNHFTVHMRTHRSLTGEPTVQPSQETKNKIKFPCTVCNKMCTSRSNLAVHLRRHSGEMTKFCSVCGKGYPRSTDLTIHMRKHTGERPFACHQCNRRFTRSDKLNIHLRVHTKEKPYVCENCGRAFSQSNDLASHRKRNVCDSVKAKKGSNITNHT